MRFSYFANAKENKTSRDSFEINDYSRGFWDEVFRNTLPDYPNWMALAKDHLTLSNVIKLTTTSKTSY